MITVQQQDFCVAEEYNQLIEAGKTGAIVTFIGRVRDFAGSVEGFYLQHYPGMTERVLQQIVLRAKQRWALQQVRVVHRVGELAASEQIVLVGVSSAHRSDAFQACEYIIDLLKTEAPFWKKEGGHWVEAKASDSAAADRWLRGAAQ